MIYLLTVCLHCLSTATLDYKSKIAIVASVVSMVALLAGGTLAMFYCKRKDLRRGSRHRPALIEEMDDNRL